MPNLTLPGLRPWKSRTKIFAQFLNALVAILGLFLASLKEGESILLKYQSGTTVAPLLFWRDVVLYYVVLYSARRSGVRRAALGPCFSDLQKSVAIEMTSILLHITIKY